MSAWGNACRSGRRPARRCSRSAVPTDRPGRVREIRQPPPTVEILAGQVGASRLQSGTRSFAFAAGALNRDESDLRACATGRWGRWSAGETSWTERSVAWLLLVLALAMLSLHLVLVSKRL